MLDPTTDHPQTPGINLSTTPPVVDDVKSVRFPRKKTTRQWDAWTREEEESFFAALRHVGKNFEKITSRVQSKNKDQVRHYYYRLLKRMNKLLGPGFLLDPKNSKDANSAMLRWWSLLEKHSVSASKLHLKPRRFKTFVTALEHQLSKDRKRANKKQAPRAVSVVPAPMLESVSGKSTTCSSESAKSGAAGALHLEKAGSGRGSATKRKTEHTSILNNKAQSSRPRRQRKKSSECTLSAAEFKRWEKVASAGVNLVAEAAEQLERAAAAEQIGPVGLSWKNLKPCTSSSVVLHSESNLDARKTPPPTSYTQADSGLRDLSQGNHEETVVETGKQANKLKLQLFPIDEATRKSLEQDGLNPYLELTLKPRKAISSVLQHLAQKWARCSVAAGHPQLFPFSMQAKNLSVCQSWSLDDALITAGDVHAALGHPSVFRLRYGWLPSRTLQSSNAEPPQFPGGSASAKVCVEAGLQVNSGATRAIAHVEPSICVPSSLEVPSTPCTTTENTFSRVGYTTSPQTKAGVCAHVEQSAAQAACTHCNRTFKSSTTEQVEFLNSSMSGGEVTALAQSAKGSTNTENQAGTDPRRLGSLKKPLLGSTEFSNALGQVEVRHAVSLSGEGHAGPKIQDSAVHLGSCSWLYEGSNDGFSQRIWAVEDSTDNVPLLPTEIDWVDSLTNISISELLNEVSQAAHMPSGTVSNQASHPTDSFDAAVAAQSGYASRSGSSFLQHSETPAWDGEETCDAFAFQKVISQRGAPGTVNCGIEPSTCQHEALKGSDGMSATLPDCGSLEAWKQSFSHLEVSFPEELKGGSGSQLLQQQPDLAGKRCSSEEFYWGLASVN